MRGICYRYRLSLPVCAGFWCARRRFLRTSMRNRYPFLFVLAAAFLFVLAWTTSSFADDPSKQTAATASGPSKTVSGLPSFIPLVKRYGPSVVNISSKQADGLGPQDFSADDGYAGR